MKRIITCSDGTWNKHGSTDRGTVVETNVEKMFNSICAQGLDTATGQPVMQKKIYDEGVGTGYTFKDRFLGGATGSGIDKNIKDVYCFLMMNYEPGDEIYLFGFSRGAYTARSIAGFIRNCGILQPLYIHLIDRAYDLYRDRNDYSTPDSDLMISFRKQYCVEEVTPIKFIGVWDTVGSLGIPLPAFRLQNNNKYKFHDVKLSSTINYAYHALSIDERRFLFKPTLWQQSETVKSNAHHKQVLEQRWFAGVHSNVGGGYSDCGLSDVALTWLINKAQNVGLCFHNPPVIKVTPDYYKGELRNSYTPMYWFWLPHWRQIPIRKKEGSVIDLSAWKRFLADSSYRPRSLYLFYKALKAGKKSKIKGNYFWHTAVQEFRNLLWLYAVALILIAVVFFVLILVFKPHVLF